MIYKDKSTQDNKAFWESVERIANEVRNWPEWKKGQAQEMQVQTDQQDESTNERNKEETDLR